MTVEETTNITQNNNGYMPQFGWWDALLIILLIFFILSAVYRHRNDKIDKFTDWEMENNDGEGERDSL